jgi:hypothetical protein
LATMFSDDATAADHCSLAAASGDGDGDGDEVEGVLRPLTLWLAVAVAVAVEVAPAGGLGGRADSRMPSARLCCSSAPA